MKLADIYVKLFSVKHILYCMIVYTILYNLSRFLMLLFVLSYQGCRVTRMPYARAFS